MLKKIVNLKTGLLLAFILLLGGCSANFTYNNIGWLSGFWIDDYVDLDKQQAKTVKQLVKQTRDWHRKTQLPLYKTDLVHLQQLLAESPSQAELITHFTNSKTHWQTLVNKIAQPLIDVAMTLNSEQRQYFIEAIKEQMHEEQHEFAKQSVKERKTERLEEQLQRYNDWLGKLSSRQVSLITAANEQHLSTFELWQEYKKTRLNVLADTFSDPSFSDKQFVENMRHIITQRHAFMSDALKQADKQNLALYATLLVDLRATLTAKQIEKANKKFNEMIEQMDDLIAG
ncbi:DUF6279 family lipoprotein [Pseudoalteromonas sp. ZZD1]|uniref:DUF6279 family lipoprotein n=1 Tax=Pseudoalteromonas sp. ZZD1 TaxID=3139395 RepID=UPI003BAB19AF